MGPIMRISIVVVVLVFLASAYRADEPTLLTTLPAHKGAVRGVAFSPKDDLLASAGDDGCVRLWKPGGKKVANLDHGCEVLAVAFTSDGKLLASGGLAGTLKVWEVSTGKEVLCVQAALPIMELTFIDHDQFILVAYPRLGLLTRPNDSYVLATGQVTPALKSVARQTEDGPCLTAGNVVARVRKLPGEGEGQGMHFPAAIDVSWPDESGSVTVRRTLQRHDFGINCLAAGPGFKLLASGSEDHTVKVWDVNSGTCTATLKPNLGEVYGVAFSPDGRLLASCGADGTIAVWRMPGEVGVRP
jgi:WD40 repeat protein